MANEHLILCGSARPSSRAKVWKKATPVHLGTDRGTGNVNLRISDIARPLAANLTPRELDLLEIATYVYCADQAVTRGGLKTIDYGRSWIRTFRFEMPVRDLDFWSSNDVSETLRRMLGNVSGDNFEFAFCPLMNPPTPDAYFEWGSDAPSEVEEVLLFSGGLDSFGGAVRQVLLENRKVALVSHRPVSKIDSLQRQLVTDIAARASEKKKAPVHVPVLVNKAKDLGRDYTQRTRSFLYASLAAIVARLFELNRILFYENGVTSLNLPISPQVVSTRATRTTHPMVLAGYRRLFNQVFGSGFEIENPFFRMTKTEILQEIKEAGHSRLCAYTVSCAHTWQQTKVHTHCGKCSQCVERRLVALAAGYGEDEDPPEMYDCKFLTDDLSGEDRLLVESYIETIGRIQKLETAQKFCVQYPEIGRAINHVEYSADVAAQVIFDLYRRHAQQVGDALDAQGRAAIALMRFDELPTNCGLRIAFGGRQPIATTPDQQPHLTVAGMLVLNEQEFSVTWKDQDPLTIGNRKEFRLLEGLAKSPEKFIASSHLAEQMGGDATDEIKHIKSRLTTLLSENGLGDLAACIRTEKGYYGLFLRSATKM